MEGSPIAVPEERSDMKELALVSLRCAPCIPHQQKEHQELLQEVEATATNTGGTVLLENRHVTTASARTGSRSSSRKTTLLSLTTAAAGRVSAAC
uniref:Uncharacterized protein n=1 Tax=Timema cristinae TaxID=61476 RepID=A0A7R9CCM0_TIMCR|nr:unnamed protein product [Timema cristinae]